LFFNYEPRFVAEIVQAKDPLTNSPSQAAERKSGFLEERIARRPRSAAQWTRIPLFEEVMNALMRRKPGTTHFLISHRE
jgi:hypothetical protein